MRIKLNKFVFNNIWEIDREIERYLVRDAVNVLDQVNDTAAVAELVVIPRDELDEVVVERDASLGVEDRRVVVTNEIWRDNL